LHEFFSPIGELGENGGHLSKPVKTDSTVFNMSLLSCIPQVTIDEKKPMLFIPKNVHLSTQWILSLSAKRQISVTSNELGMEFKGAVSRGFCCFRSTLG